RSNENRLRVDETAKVVTLPEGERRLRRAREDHDLSTHLLGRDRRIADSATEDRRDVLAGERSAERLSAQRQREPKLWNDDEVGVEFERRVADVEHTRRVGRA